MAAKDLSKMSPKELDELIQEAQAVKAGARDRARSTLRAKFDTDLAREGFTINEVYPGRGGARKNAGGASVARFRHPDNPAMTWTGRGRKPNWLVDALKRGAKMDSFAIA